MKTFELVCMRTFPVVSLFIFLTIAATLVVLFFLAIISNPYPPEHQPIPPFFGVCAIVSLYMGAQISQLLTSRLFKISFLPAQYIKYEKPLTLVPAMLFILSFAIYAALGKQWFNEITISFLFWVFLAWILAMIVLGIRTTLLKHNSVANNPPLLRKIGF